MYGSCRECHSIEWTVSLPFEISGVYFPNDRRFSRILVIVPKYYYFSLFLLELCFIDRKTKDREIREFIFFFWKWVYRAPAAPVVTCDMIDFKIKCFGKDWKPSELSRKIFLWYAGTWELTYRKKLWMERRTVNTLKSWKPSTLVLLSDLRCCSFPLGIRRRLQYATGWRNYPPRTETGHTIGARKMHTKTAVSWGKKGWEFRQIK